MAKAYRVDVSGKIRFAGSQGEATTRRNDILGSAKKSEAVTEEIELPTDKKGLIQYLNQLMAEIEGIGADKEATDSD